MGKESKVKGQKIKKPITVTEFLGRWGTTIGMLVVLLALGIHAPRFFAPNNLLDVLKQGSILTLIAIAQAVVLIPGGFDMSAGALSQLTANVAAGLIIAGLGTWSTIGVGLVLGLIIGLINASLVIVARIPAFVATLGTMFVLQGATLMYNKGQALTINDQKGFTFLGQGYIGPIPFIVILVILVILVLHLFMKNTKTGLRMYAVGENLTAAKLRGISSKKALIIGFALAGLIVGFTGVAQASYSYGATAVTTGMDFLISALAAAFLGSTLSKTGELSIVGAGLAGMFISALSNVLIINGVSNNVLPGILGAVLVLSIIPTVIRKREIGQVTIF